MNLKKLLKFAVVVLVLGGVGFLFVRSADDAREAAYTVDRAHLKNWQLSIESADVLAAPVLVLKPPQQLAAALFRQVFSRGMESLVAPTMPTVPLLLRSELESGFGGQLTTATILAAARAAQLESATFMPRCLGYRRISDPGVTKQLYFLVFESPAFDQFRQSLAARPEASVGTFNPLALSPVMFIGTAGATLNQWLPLRVDAAADCVAPVELLSDPSGGTAAR